MVRHQVTQLALEPARVWHLEADFLFLQNRRRQQAVERAAHTRPAELDWYVTHAHNVYLQTLAETGIVGVLAGLGALAAIGWLMLGAVRRRDREATRWVRATAFTLVFLGVTCLFDNYANMPAVLLLGVVPIAWLDATSDRRMGLPGIGERGSSLAGRAAAAVLFGLSALAVVTLARTESIVAAHERTAVLVDDGDWAAAERAIAAVIADDPDMTPYQVTRGLVASALGDWIGFIAIPLVLAILVAISTVSETGDTDPGEATSFELPTTAGNTVALDETLADGDTLLYFSMGVGCDGCFAQIPEIENALAERGMNLLSIMVDPAPMVAAEAARFGIETPILIDAGAQVSQDYGMVGVYGHTDRPSHSFALVDPAGKVRWVRHYAEMFVPAAAFFAELDSA